MNSIIFFLPAIIDCFADSLAAAAVSDALPLLVFNISHYSAISSGLYAFRGIASLTCIIILPRLLSKISWTYHTGAGQWQTQYIQNLYQKSVEMTAPVYIANI
jgi:hypothetical protein